MWAKCANRVLVSLSLGLLTVVPFGPVKEGVVSRAGCGGLLFLRPTDSIGTFRTWRPQRGSPIPPRLAKIGPDETRARAKEFISRRPRCNLSTCEYCCLVTAVYVLTGRELSFTDALRVRELPETRQIELSEVYLFIFDFRYNNNRGLPYFHAGIYYPRIGLVHSRIGNRWKRVPLRKYRKMAASKGYTMHFHRW